MAQFLYQAKDREQKSVQGTVDADSPDSAVTQILGLGLVPMDVRPAVAVRSPRPHAVKGTLKVRREQVVFFIRQMSDLVSAGVNVLRALTLTAKQAQQSSLKELIAQMADQVRDGVSLSEAMARYPHIFPRTYSSLIRAGESSGKLGEVLSRLADLAQRSWETRTQVVTAMAYPGLILTVGLVMIVGLIVGVVPKITAVFEEMDQALPWATAVLLGVSDFLSRYGGIVLIVLIAVALAVYRMGRTAWGRQTIDRLKLRLPVVGVLIKEVEIGRFARTMATLLGNGVSMTTALEVTAQVMGNHVIQKEVQGFLQVVSHGMSLNGALKRSSLFPESVSAMVAVGEESGSLHQGLARMAEYFENQSQRRIKTITTLIEPVLILALGLTIGLIVLAMLLPILQMNTMIQ